MSSIGSYSTLPFTAFAQPGNDQASEAEGHDDKSRDDAIAAPNEIDSSSASGSAGDSQDKAEEATAPGPKAPNGEALTDEQLAQLRELKARDQEVRAHEQAHLAAAGQHAVGGPKYEYQVGPDGRRYAVGGSVAIDTSEVPGDPQATIRKARQIRAAALAPAEPSSQDRAIASSAARLLSEAQAELQELQREKIEQTGTAGDFEQAGTGDSAGADSSETVPSEAGILVDRAV